MIADKIDDTDHAMVYSKLTTVNTVEQSKGRDLFTKNTQLIHTEETRKKLVEAIHKTVNKHKKGPNEKQKTFGTFKYNIRKILKRATLEHASNDANGNIADIDRLFSILHIAQTKKPSPEGAAARIRLIEERMEIRNKFLLLNQEIGIDVLTVLAIDLPQSHKHLQRGIYRFNSRKALKCYRHLYTKPPTSEGEIEAKEKLFTLLEEGNGNDFSTSKEAGQPISVTEINKILSHLPESVGSDHSLDAPVVCALRCVARLYATNTAVQSVAVLHTALAVVGQDFADATARGGSIGKESQR
eukprot:3281474-Pleurochrysis_carterae.AAC.2